MSEQQVWVRVARPAIPAGRVATVATSTTTSPTSTSGRATRRPGDPAYGNASFGAVIPRSTVSSVADTVAFYREGLSRLID